MQHIILVFRVTCTLQELHLYPALIYSAKFFDKYSAPHNQHSLEIIIGADSFASAVP